MSRHGNRRIGTAYVTRHAVVSEVIGSLRVVTGRLGTSSAKFWLNRFGPLFAAEIRKRRVHHHSYSNWRWHLDEVFVRINGRRTICGVPLIMKAKCSRFLQRNGEIAGLH